MKPRSWAGERDATRFAPYCPQDDGTAAYYRRAARRLGRDTAAVPRLPGHMSEDCLYLNVWAPSDQGRGPLPVLVWVHGGSGTSGSGSDPLFRGAALARRGLVVVTLNYRLGALGFLAHPALTRESPDGTSGNYALRDLIRALHWVRDNARAFGGDPDRITLAGQSAGASLVEILMVVPAARQLFRHAISESATRIDPPPLTAPPGEESAEASGVRFLRALGVERDATASELRSIPTDSLLAAQGRSSETPTLPVADGRLLAASSVRRWSDRGAPVPLLKGSADDEFSLFLRPEPLTPAEYRAWIRSRYGDMTDIVLAASPPGDDAESTRRQRVRLLSDELFRAPMAAMLRHAGHAPPIWLYRFAWRPDSGAVGAFHGVELPFVFGTHSAAGWWEPTSDIERLTEIVQGAWARFAATGDPNGPGLPSWPPASRAAPSAMVLQSNPHAAPLPRLTMLRAFADRLLASGSHAR